ncbi:MAG: IPT/TIG domain-containing protein [Nitrospira sp.]|nr:IPT/TIG domain-containing protein [Nitrospira sp.]MDH4368913.1 IPT/TIG domain-containing protein [Nitrospira sp.]MDH5347339.1 IPT/TIG domain-containing protein [Nitrospira sp.]MDH5496768.1 IPT/TIG domain-containing protein [Nitrospira sp.]
MVPLILSSLLVVISLLLPSFSVHAVAEEGVIVDGAGYTLHDAESIKGHDEQTVEKDPICDSSKKPTIVSVEPDEAKPGQTIMITGEQFGTKDCFRGVTFSAAGPTTIDYTYVNDTSIKATVPDVRPGMSFIDVIASGGNARSKAFLIQAK